MALAKLQNLLLSVILEGRFFYGFAGDSPELRRASPDHETTSQQDNEWGYAALRRIYGIMDLRNYGTGATLRYAGQRT